MTVALCILASVVPLPADCQRGGHALPARDHGGHAVEVWIKPPYYDEFMCIHSHEAKWNANTGNGYHGGLQMDWNFMRAYGRDMLQKYHGRAAEVWTPLEQIIVAARAVKKRRFGPWPNTRIPCGV